MSGSVNLGPHLEEVVSHLIASGRYGSRSEILREGVRMLEARENERLRLNDALTRGLSDVEAGRVTDIEEVRARLLSKYASEA